MNSTEAVVFYEYLSNLRYGVVPLAGPWSLNHDDRNVFETIKILRILYQPNSTTVSLDLSNHVKSQQNIRRLWEPKFIYNAMGNFSHLATWEITHSRHAQALAVSFFIPSIGEEHEPCAGCSRSSSPGPLAHCLRPIDCSLRGACTNCHYNGITCHVPSMSPSPLQ